MRWVFDDGGRAAAGYKGRTGDCGVRALAIAAELPYQDAVEIVLRYAADERITKRRPTRSATRTGIRRSTMRKLLADRGWQWFPIMGIGTGCRVHMDSRELPGGRLIVSLSRHYAAVVDGVLHDTFDCTRRGTRCVYGYWWRAA